MDQIKEAFGKVKKDISSLKEEIMTLKKGFLETREKIIEICNILKKLNGTLVEMKETQENLKMGPLQTTSTQRDIFQTTSTDLSTQNKVLSPLNGQNRPISIGNEGVQTDRQTDQQTDNFTEKTQKNRENSFESAAKILDSLDNIKKELRLKFKRLTEQEVLVFSTIYQLEEEGLEVDYKTLSKRLKLTESSIRDYVGRLMKKDIPLEKKKLNNKTILISISPNLKKVATLATILQLRGI